jgi:hypothetical protein
MSSKIALSSSLGYSPASKSKSSRLVAGIAATVVAVRVVSIQTDPC